MSSELESRVVRKITLRIVPFVMLLYFVSFLDRVNVGFAALTMNSAIGLTPAMFGLGGGIFFLGYFLLEVPSNLILHRVGSLALCDGSEELLCPSLFAWCRGSRFFPGELLYLSLWFPVRHRAVTAAAFMVAASLSTVIGSPLSGRCSAILGCSRCLWSISARRLDWIRWGSGSP